MKTVVQKQVCFLIAVVLLWNGYAVAAEEGAVNPNKPTNVQESKIKAEVERRGIGEKSRVTVGLHNSTEVKGYISKIEVNAFVVTDKRSGQSTTVPYSDVARLRGPGLSKGAKIAIGAGVAIGVLAATFAVLIGKSGLGPSW